VEKTQEKSASAEKLRKFRQGQVVAALLTTAESQRQVTGRAGAGPSTIPWRMVMDGDGIYGDHGLMVKNRTMVFHHTCFFFFIGLIVINMIDHG